MNSNGTLTPAELMGVSSSLAKQIGALMESPSSRDREFADFLQSIKDTLRWEHTDHVKKFGW